MQTSEQDVRQSGVDRAHAHLRRATLAVRRELGRVREAASRAVREQGRERDLAAQSLKSALAALLSWALATWLFSDSLSLMAPWVAVVLVQATVYQSLSQGMRQAAAIAIGTALATGSAVVLGHQVLALVIVLPLTLLLGNMRSFGSQGVYVATSAIFALAGGPVTLLISVERVGAALVGAAVGIAVNALVRPPRYLRDARAAVRDLTTETADLLSDLAEGVEEGPDEETAEDWRGRADRLPARVNAVRSALEWDRESLRMNVRRRRSGSALPHDYTSYDVVNTLYQLVETTRGLTRVLRDSMERSAQSRAVPSAVAQTYGRCLADVGAAVEAYGRFVTTADDEVRYELRDALHRASAGHHRLSEKLDLSALPDVGAMEILGPLLSDTRRIIRQLDV